MMTSLNTNYGHSTTGSFILSAERRDDLVQEILALLPYKYFKADEQAKDAFWRQVITAVDGGEQDVTRLAGLYQHRGAAIARDLKIPVDLD